MYLAFVVKNIEVNFIFSLVIPVFVKNMRIVRCLLYADQYKRYSKQYETGETPVLVMCSDKNEYICKYMRSLSPAYNLFVNSLVLVLLKNGVYARQKWI